jgi:catechol 2,3-dioxygenase-like lactoylglutathione lyase family enzyme
MRMDHVSLAVSDVDKSVDFYSKALNLKLLRVSVLRRAAAVHPTPKNEYKNAYMYSGTFLLELMTAKSAASKKEAPRTWQESMRGFIGITHLGLRVRNLDAAVQRLKDAGAVMIQEPYELAREKSKFLYVADKVDPRIRYARKPGKKPWRLAVFSDPDGVIIELVER